MARRLLERINSAEPLDEVIVDVVTALDALTNGEVAELLNAIGRRHGRDRAGGAAPPETESGQE